jgi:phosphate transport system substrate-binding protein
MRKIAGLLVITITLLAVLPGCTSSGPKGSGDSKDTLIGKLTISGAFALYPLAVRWGEEFHKIHPRVFLNISAGGAGKGMADALSHMVDIGMYSKSVSPEEQAKGAWWIAVSKDAVLATISDKNPELAKLKAEGLTKQKFYDIFISGKIKTWGEAAGTKNRNEILVFTRSDACGAAEMWARFLSGKKQEDLQGIGVNGDPGVADAIRKNPNALGYNNLNFVFDIQTRKKYAGLEVIPIDINGNGKIDPEENFYGSLEEVVNAISDGRYPSPPARDLYFVSAGKPVNPIVRAFLHWVLTDGQKYVHEAGYVSLTPEKIQAEQIKLQ